MAARGNKEFRLAVLFMLIILGLALLLVASLRALENWSEANVVFLATGIIAVMLPVAAYTIAAGEGEASRESLELLRSINERMLLSEVSRQARNRQQDRDSVRQAIHEEINRKDFQAALVMVEQLGSIFGYVKEAEELRDEISRARRAELDQQIEQAIRGLESLIQKHDWEASAREATKIQRIYVDAERTQGLTKRVRDAREQYKQELERKFLEAAGRDDVETAMELLKELDGYLSEAEAEPFRETARGVIGKKRQNLGVQFKLAVNDRDMTQAVKVGEQIIREFPNSKMANEVRSMLDRLRAAAAEEQRARQNADAARPAAR
ncbi:MAG: hypothetical protein NTW19_00435 [Planctomycetota bacterium]|nr:hypothetical protein [Planctomycetota bacterium]